MSQLLIVTLELKVTLITQWANIKGNITLCEMFIKLRSHIYKPGFAASYQAANYQKECYNVLIKWEQNNLNDTLKKMKNIAKFWREQKEDKMLQI